MSEELETVAQQLPEKTSASDDDRLLAEDMETESVSEMDSLKRELEQLKSRVQNNEKCIEQMLPSTSSGKNSYQYLKEENEELRKENRKLRQERTKSEKEFAALKEAYAELERKLNNKSKMLEQEKINQPLFTEVVGTSKKRKIERTASELVEMSLKGKSSNERNKEKKDHGRVLKEGRIVEAEAEVAFIGDSNFRGLLEYELREWQLDKGVLVRCYSGGKANDLLKKCSLPDKSRVNTVVLGIGGNDLNDCNDILNELEEENEKRKADEVIRIVAKKITEVAGLYQDSVRRVFVMLPGLRRRLRNEYVLKLNRICKEELDSMRIAHLDTAEEMLKEKQLTDCVLDGVHYRDSFFKKMMRKICLSIDLPFRLPDIRPINWPSTMPGICFACGEKTTSSHESMKCANRKSFECTICQKAGHKTLACRARYEQCLGCGAYGHYKQTCPWLQSKII